MATLIIDTNLLVLYVVGATDKECIQRHKRLHRIYTIEDYDLLLDIISVVDNILATPNTFTETSNLIRQISDPDRTKIMETFKAVISNTNETYCESKTASNSVNFLRLGLTDSVISSLCSQSTTLVTVDFNLYQAALRNGGDAINFNHLREERGIFIS